MDHTAIPDLLSRYFAAIDDDALEIELLRSVFTDDCRVVRPHGDPIVGPDALLDAQMASFARFSATQHRLTDVLVDTDDDRARIRANLVAIHLWAPDHLPPTALEAHFGAGSVVRAEARDTPDGWRIESLAVTPTWRSGSGMGAMLATR
ncbi:hypothetical protein GCM10009624_08350 [Gordonia sinesedis]